MRRVCLVATSSFVLAASGGAQPPITKDDQPKSAQQTLSGGLRKYGDFTDNVAEGAGFGAEPQEVGAYLKDAVEVSHKMEKAGLADARSSLQKGEPAGESFEKYMPQGSQEDRTNAAQDEGTTAKQGSDDAWKGQKTGYKVERGEIGQSNKVEEAAQKAGVAYSKLGWSTAVRGEKMADTFSRPGQEKTGFGGDYAAKAGAAEDSFEKLGSTYADKAGKTTQTFEKEGSGFDKKASPSASSNSASTERGAKDSLVEKPSADVNMLLSLPDANEDFTYNVAEGAGFGAEPQEVGAYLKDAVEVSHKMENAGLADARSSLKKGEPAGESFQKYMPQGSQEESTNAAQDEGTTAKQGSDDAWNGQKTGSKVERGEIGQSNKVMEAAQENEGAYSKLGWSAAVQGEKMADTFSTPGGEKTGFGGDYAAKAGAAEDSFEKLGSTYADRAGKTTQTFEKEGSGFDTKALEEEATTATAKKPAGEKAHVEKAAKNAVMDKAPQGKTSVERVTAEEAVEKNVEEKAPAGEAIAERAGERNVDPSASKKPADEKGATKMTTAKRAVKERAAAKETASKKKVEARKSAKEKASVQKAAEEEPAEEREGEAAVEKVPADEAVEKEARKVEKPSADVNELRSTKRGKKDELSSSAAESSKLSSWKAGKMPLASCASVTVLGVLVSLLAFFNRRRARFEDIGDGYLQV